MFVAEVWPARQLEKKRLATQVYQREYRKRKREEVPKSPSIETGVSRGVESPSVETDGCGGVESPSLGTPDSGGA